MLLPEDYVLWLRKLDQEDKHEIGIEFSSLGELAQQRVLTVPTIIITPFAFTKFQEDNNLHLQIKHLLGTLNSERHDSLSQVADFLQKMINHAQIPRAIYEPLFRLYEQLDTKTVSLEAYYFRDKKMLSRKMWTAIEGEAVLVEKVRFAWAHLFSMDNLTTYDIHTKNHHTFSVCLAVRPSVEFELTGTVRTDTKRKGGEYEIKVHAEDNNLLTKGEVETLLDYAKICDTHVPFPQIIHFGRMSGKLYVTTVLPVSDEISYPGTYIKFLEGESFHPGITVGKLRIISGNVSEDISHDEIIHINKVDKNMVSLLKKAKGLIVENDIDPEVGFLLKSFGIPTIIRAKNVKAKFAQGEVVSLNATTGEVKRGSVLI